MTIFNWLVSDYIPHSFYKQKNLEHITIVTEHQRSGAVLIRALWRMIISVCIPAAGLAWEDRVNEVIALTR